MKRCRVVVGQFSAPIQSNVVVAVVVDVVVVVDGLICLILLSLLSFATSSEAKEAFA